MSAKTRTVLSCIILVLAVAFLAIGIYTGELETVFTKATNVCLECIGIG